MKKYLCMILVFVLLAAFAAGCRSQEETVFTPPSDSTPTESKPVESTPTTPSSQPATEPSSAPTAPATQPTTTPTTPPTTPPTTQPTTGPAQDSNLVASGTCDNGAVTWKVTKDGTLSVTGTGPISEKSSYPWIKHFRVITKIVVGGGITSLPKNAFAHLHDVTSVVIGDGVKTLEAYAIYNCTNLTTVTIAASVETIGNGAFASCAKLREVKFAENSQLKTIGQRAFKGSGIREFDAPDNLQTIGERAFYECKDLESIRLDGTVSTLEEGAFQDCTGLKEVYFGPSITTMGSQVFDGCDAITKLEDYCPKIFDFIHLEGLTTVIIGGDRTATSRYGYCPNLSNVTILSPITHITSGAFQFCPKVKEFTVPETVTFIGGGAFRTTGITSINIPDGVTTIGEYAFDHTNIQSITIPATVTKMGNYAFYQSGLKTITFLGNCPFGKNAMLFSMFSGVTAYYPKNNDTWTEEILAYNDSFATWVAQ